MTEGNRPPACVVFPTYGRLWSLWEMVEEFKAGELVRLIHSLISNTSLGTNDKDPLLPGLRPLLLSDFRILLQHCEALDLDVPADYCRTALLILSGAPGPHETGTMARMANMVCKAIEIQLKSRMFLALQPADAKLFRQSFSLGRPESGSFGEASYELDEAIKCLALDRSTASVFHSIRCLEDGIRALSRCLGIKDPTKSHERSWQKLLSTLKAAIDEKWPANSHRETGDGEFFDNAYAALAAMQNPWRNATMHLDQKYTESEARHIFEVVRGFMARLANRMDENGEPKA